MINGNPLLQFLAVEECIIMNFVLLRSSLSPPAACLRADRGGFGELFARGFGHAIFHRDRGLSFSMGIGSYLSKFVQKQLTTIFIRVEILVGLVGGCSAAALFLLFDQVASFRLVLYSLVVIVGTMVGLEIPLLMRILKGQYEFKDLVSKVFTFDYIGALLASLSPLVLVPHLWAW